MKNIQSEKNLGEEWRLVTFPFHYINDLRIEVSSLGNVRSSSAVRSTNQLKPQITNGYKVAKLKFFNKRSPEIQKQFDYMKEQISKLTKVNADLKMALKRSKKKNEKYYSKETRLQRGTKLVANMKLNYRAQFHADELSRTMNVSALIHRMVAECFVEPKSERHTIVAHKNYNKYDNRTQNLVWMTPEENTEHQKGSPLVIEAKLKKIGLRNENNKHFKLTSTKVMMIKKRIAEGASLKVLSKSFGVSETQLKRIQDGKNWSDIKAAK